MAETIIERLERAHGESCGCTNLGTFEGAAERIRALEAALKPFAATGELLLQSPSLKVKDDACWAGQQPAAPITYGNLRTAARLLAE